MALWSLKVGQFRQFRRAAARFSVLSVSESTLNLAAFYSGQREQYFEEGALSSQEAVPLCSETGMVKTMIFLIKIKIKINRFDVDFYYFKKVKLISIVVIST